MKRLLFVGNSHLVAVRDAALRLSGAPVDRDGTDFMWRQPDYETTLHHLRSAEGGDLLAGFIAIGPSGPLIDDHEELTAPFAAALDQITSALGGAPDQLVSYLNGAEPAIFGMVEHREPFDVFVARPDTPASPDGPARQVVPPDVIRRVMREWLDIPLRHCRALQRAFPDVPLVHVLPPPPVPDDDYVAGHAELFTAAVEANGVAPAALRRKVYDLYVELVDSTFVSAGITVLRAPDDAVVDGFLASGMWLHASHASDRYGRLVLGQLGV